MSAIDVSHAIAQADLALGTAGLRPDNILRRELRASGAAVAELIEAAKESEWALAGMLRESMGDAAEAHIRNPLPDSMLAKLRAALARCGGTK
jgi:hypothetical protein